MRLRASSSGTSKGDPHDCWTTTEAALTRDLSDDLREAWERLRETAVSFGDQRIYASHKSIMFSRKSCYFFVRPKKTALEVCVFLARALTTPQVRRVDRASKSKLVHFIHLQHRDQVEAPITDWLREAYELSGVLATRAAAKRVKKKSRKLKGKAVTLHSARIAVMGSMLSARGVGKSVPANATNIVNAITS